MSRLNSEILARERQEALYAFLLSRKAGEWTQLRDLSAALGMTSMYPDYTTQNFHNSTARRWITADIEAINENPDFEKVIIHGRNGVKLATEAEFDNYLRAEFAEVFKKLKRVRKIQEKGNLDQQMFLEDDVWRSTFMEGS